MKALILKSLVVLNVLLAMACAKEVSDEKKRREENNRTFERLQTAAGIFDGYVAVENDRGSPVTLTVTPKRNPSSGNDAPVLEVVLQLGLFGGVNLTSTDASYDWGSGLLNVKFTKAGGAGSAAAGQKGEGAAGQNVEGAGGPGPTTDSVELRVKIVQGQISDAVISGPRTGSHEVALKSRAGDGASALAEYQVALSMQADPTSPVVPAVLSLRRDVVEVAAPQQSSDLPYLPPLVGSLRFKSLADAPQKVSGTFYDPLAGTIDLVLSNSSTLTLKNVFAPVDAGSQTLQLTKSVDFSGTIGILSRGSGSVKAVWSPQTTSLTDELGGLPPTIYVGSYQGSSGGRKLRAIARFDFPGGSATNPREYGFTSFPTTRLIVYPCVGGRPTDSRVFAAVGFDYLHNRVAMTQGSGGGSTMDLFFNDRWQTLDGYIYDVGIPRGDPGQSSAQIHLAPAAIGENPSCQVSTTPQP